MRIAVLLFKPVAEQQNGKEQAGITEKEQVGIQNGIFGRHGQGMIRIQNGWQTGTPKAQTNGNHWNFQAHAGFGRQDTGQGTEKGKGNADGYDGHGPSFVPLPVGVFPIVQDGRQGNQRDDGGRQECEPQSEAGHGVCVWIVVVLCCRKEWRYVEYL